MHARTHAANATHHHHAPPLPPGDMDVGICRPSPQILVKDGSRHSFGQPNPFASAADGEIASCAYRCARAQGCVLARAHMQARAVWVCAGGCTGSGLNSRACW